MWTRRLFIGSLGVFGALAASAAAYVGIAKSNAPRHPLLIDPDETEFVYVDGVVVKLDRVR